ncbi:hypothetical protein RP20_CCG023096 [Aedes albopictus]|nr:hypothetical protein RP20_CCG023096 [Aedes albopictus]
MNPSSGFYDPATIVRRDRKLGRRKERAGKANDLFSKENKRKVKTRESTNDPEKTKDRNTELPEVTKMIRDLSKQSCGAENFGAVVENELFSMRAIEEAAQQIE